MMEGLLAPAEIRAGEEAGEATERE